MKITKSYLKQIILEETNFVLENNPYDNKSIYNERYVENELKNLKDKLSTAEYNFELDILPYIKKLSNKHYVSFLNDLQTLEKKLLNIYNSPEGDLTLVQGIILNIRYSIEAFKRREENKS